MTISPAGEPIPLSESLSAAVWITAGSSTAWTMTEQRRMDLHENNVYSGGNKFTTWKQLQNLLTLLFHLSFFVCVP